MMLSKRHCARIIPAVDNLGNALHFAAALFTLNRNLVNERAVKLDIVGAVIAELFKLGNRADGMSVAAGAFPDVKRSAPITVTADAPILNIFKPVTEATLAYAFGNPVNRVVILNKIILNRSHLDKPRFSCVINQRSVAAPAERIIMLKFRSGEKLAFFVKIGQHKRVCVLYEFACIGSFLGHIALAVNKLNKGQIIGSAYSCVVLAESGSDVNYARAVRHGNIAVGSNEMSLFILLFGGVSRALEQRLVFLALKLLADIAFDYFIRLNAVFFISERAENGVKQSLCHIICVAVRRLDLAVSLVGIYAERAVGGQSPRSCSPSEEISVLSLDLKSDNRRALLDRLVALCNLVG